METQDQMGDLGQISIFNRGGEPGVATRGGRGAPGCSCTVSQWSGRICEYQRYYRKRQQNGPDGFPLPPFPWEESSQTTERPCDGNYEPWPHPNHPGSDSTYDNEWRLVGERYLTYSCSAGNHGSNGRDGVDGSRGRYGSVGILIGGNGGSRPEVNETLAFFAGKIVNLSAYAYTEKTGLTSLISSESDVLDTFFVGIFASRNLQLIWSAPTSIEQSGFSGNRFSARFSGTTLDLSLPRRLITKRSETADTTVIKVIHVIGPNSEKNFPHCAQYHKKGSYRCEFSGLCRYDAENDGLCLPK